ncbi:SDR family oxidoreductase [Litorilinea aerophila]|uniref:SDR family oxidoreductase n=1 Tax=Litorilinea aerophila TaxID=1204385 RepID=A0A540VI08_9CHLR|nr:SDR family oxidoreductase [Litorilinea aerophila]MCC9076469.1 SDR family oxidoreductase [Litorilinea aerophila]OUC09860.1 hypothetical protein RY27_00290 [Litorilinea aerophila]GIV79622.1 MAG: beta-ketoacyl-ACP reductase [Litorilinea sp.]
MTLTGRVALITGGAGGLGTAMAWAIAQEGAAVAVTYHHNRTRAETLVSAMRAAGHRATAVQGDLSTHQGPAALCAAVEEALGPIDILVNNAGDWVDKPLLELQDDEWDRLIHTDLRGTFLTIRAVAPGMVERGWGRIVNVSSVASLNYVPGEGVYGVAKAGINHLTKSFAVELARHGVTVNAVAPGWTLPADAPYPPDPADFPQCADVPNGRPGHAREVAALVCFLLGDHAAHITGQVLPVDGGLSAFMPKGR